jgi:hypothetical protein
MELSLLAFDLPRDQTPKFLLPFDRQMVGVDEIIIW